VFAVARKPSKEDWLKRLRAFRDGCRRISSSTATRPMPGSFSDTNVLIYLASGDSQKADRAEEILNGGDAISVQVLNEIANVARRKMSMSRTGDKTIPRVRS
jgi:hypothetical protein